MASKKSAATLDRETSQRVVKRDTITSLRKELAAARKERDFFKENSLRKEGVILMLQKKVSRLEGQAPRAQRPSKDDLAAYFAAHPGAKSVAPAALAAFLAAGQPASAVAEDSPPWDE